MTYRWLTSMHTRRPALRSSSTFPCAKPRAHSRLRPRPSTHSIPQTLAEALLALGVDRHQLLGDHRRHPRLRQSAAWTEVIAGAVSRARSTAGTMLAQMAVALLLHGPDLVQTVSIVHNAWNMPVVPVGLARRRTVSLLHGVEVAARTDER